jgi:hypothetical protein
MNHEIEIFVREKAVDFSNASLAKTFLVYTENENKNSLVGFFTLTGKSILIQNYSQLSNTYAKKVRKFSEYYERLNAQILHVILIAQFGKNYANGSDKLITGDELLDLAFEKTEEAQRIIAGKIICVECVDDPKHIDFYKRNDFRIFQNRTIAPSDYSSEQPEYLVQLLKYM